jgi:hypothetical protein
MFDQDRPRAREKVSSQRVFRGTDDPNMVLFNWSSTQLTTQTKHSGGCWSRERSTAFEDKRGPTVVVETDS